MGATKQQVDEYHAFVEERTFLRSMGYTDPQIADRLGIDWASYRRRFLRHPELGPICDPAEQERKEHDGWTKIAYPNADRRRKRPTKGEVDA